MNREQALAQLGLADRAYKPIEIDRAYLKTMRDATKSARRSPRDSNKTSNDYPSNPEERPVASKGSVPLGTHDDDIWDSLYWDWVYLPGWSTGDLEGLTDRELLALRRDYILTARADEFQLAIERDYPNRTRFSWYDTSLFDGIESLKYEGYNKCSLAGDVFSPMAFTAELARDRTQAIFVDPSLIWIEGTEIEENDDGAIRPRLDGIAYDALGYVSSLYGRCGIANAMRLVILRLGLGFDNECRMLGKSYDSFELDLELVTNAVRDISTAQKSEGVPIDTRRYMSLRNPCGMTTAALRGAILGEKSVLKDLYDDADALRAALAEKAPSDYSREDTKNLVRAIRDLDNDRTAYPSISETSYSPEDEAHDCLMQSPECMTREMGLQECIDFLAEYKTYRAAIERRDGIYYSWCYRNSCGLFARLWEDFKLLFGTVLYCAFFSFFPLSILSALFRRFFFDYTPAPDEPSIDFRVMALSIPVGFILGFVSIFSWQISLWWDKRLERMREPWNRLLEIPAILLSIRAMFLGACAGMLVGLALALFNPDTPTNIYRVVIVGGAVISLLRLLKRIAPSAFSSFLLTPESNEEAVRSAWEARIADHITAKYPSLRMVTNDRSVIRSERSFFRHLEIDIWIPELNLAIEANGEKYHDHRAYDQDVRNHTVKTREMYKERFCERRGIKLLHVWDSESTESIYHRIDTEIEARL